jgi:hypothetical protein
MVLGKEMTGEVMRLFCNLGQADGKTKKLPRVRKLYVSNSMTFEHNKPSYFIPLVSNFITNNDGTACPYHLQSHECLLL